MKLLSLAFVFTASSAFALTTVEITNAGFEQIDAKGNAVGWSKHPNWHIERGAGHNGSGGLVYECTNENDARKAGRPGQLIKLTPGKRYYFSALAKADGLKTERPSNAQGMSLYLEAYVSNKWVFGAMAKPCVRGKSKDWVKIEGETKEVPAGITRAYIQPYAPGSCVGRGVLDNILVAEYEAAPIEGVFANVYRHELTVGKVVFHASLNIDQAKALSDYSAKFSYVDSQGKSVDVVGKIVSYQDACVELEVGNFAMGKHPLTCTVSLAGKELGSASQDFVRVEKPISRKVWIDKYHRTIVDGKPYFPLGMYFRDASVSNVDVFADSAFNCLMPYVRPTKEQMDYCHTKGLKVIYNLQGGFTEKDAGEKWVRNTMPQFKDHPALLAWYTNDEHPVTDIPKLEARQKWVEELDDQHPTWSVQDVFSEIRHYLATYDVLGMDPYPIPRKPIETVISSLRQGEEGSFGTKAVWQVPQAFGWGWLKRRETKGQRAPNQEEFANMTWQSIAGGANGIVYYAFHHFFDEHDSNGADEITWAKVKETVAQVAGYEQVMLSIEKAPRAKKVPAELAIRTWRHNGYVYILAVNCTMQRQNAVVEFDEPIEKIVAADFGPAPKVIDGKLAFDFAPIGYVMLKTKVQLPVSWNRDELFAMPEVYSAEQYVPGGVTNGVYASFLKGLPFKGKDTRIFAYWGVPKGADEAHKVPAMVLVHGGGGSAFHRWVKFWNERGYAAIAMDLNGCVSGNTQGRESHKHIRHPWAGPGAAGCGGFDLMNEKPENQWMYHAVGAVARAHTFIRSQRGVDADRIGLTGISWGGVVNCVVSAIDDRFKFAAPIYGCGYLYEEFSSWTHRGGGIDTPSVIKRRDNWVSLWDPARYLLSAKIPVYWLNGTNDGNFSLPAMERCYEMVPTDKSMSLRVRMDHCHGKVSEQPVEVLTIADGKFLNGPVLPKLTNINVSAADISAKFSEDERLKVVSASLDYTLDDDRGWWYSNRWDSVSAKIDGDKVTGAIPKGAKYFYLSIKAKNGSVVSSNIFERR